MRRSQTALLGGAIVGLILASFLAIGLRVSHTIENLSAEVAESERRDQQLAEIAEKTNKAIRQNSEQIALQQEALRRQEAALADLKENQERLAQIEAEQQELRKRAMAFLDAFEKAQRESEKRQTDQRGIEHGGQSHPRPEPPPLPPPPSNEPPPPPPPPPPEPDCVLSILDVCVGT